MFVILDSVINKKQEDMEDDSKLKIIFYTGVILSIIAVIGIWESVLKPTILFVSNTVHISGVSELFTRAF